MGSRGREDGCCPERIPALPLGEILVQAKGIWR